MKKTKKNLTYTLIEETGSWEVNVDGVIFVLSKVKDNYEWKASKMGSKLENIDGGIHKTMEDCLAEMGNKYSCKFVLESERDADIRIFGKPIPCKRY